MNYSYLTKNCKLDEQRLCEYGFEKQNNSLVLKVDLLNGLLVVVTVSESKLEADVLDSIFDEKYQPFYGGHGGAAIKSQVREILEDVIAKCSQVVDTRSLAEQYMLEKYCTVGEYPWEDDNVDCTFKTAVSKKWYALIMKVTEKQLGFVGDNPVDIINVKAQPEVIPQIVDGKQYLPAYHMNKKHWLTIVLDKNTNMEKLHQLIDNSYNLVEKK